MFSNLHKNKSTLKLLVLLRNTAFIFRVRTDTLAWKKSNGEKQSKTNML